MIMLTLSVIVMCLCLYPVRLVSRVLKNTFQGTAFSGCFQLQHLRYGKKDLGIDTIFNV